MHFVNVEKLKMDKKLKMDIIKNVCYTLVIIRRHNRVRYGRLKVLRVKNYNFKMRCITEKKLLKQKRQGNKLPRNLGEEHFRSRRNTFKGPEVGTCSSHE